ncbi:TIGR04084 family radical SAM/SPASM domain-containing protein [Candidatus Pacearchaeota archaeon]|nr:TIGR04084 family radical SAM/SPASM domain-containing protein [Candidatus Pacearchaeota archaeon]
MHYHIILTEKCNSECRYCYEKSLNEFDNSLNDRFKFDFTNPEKFSVDIKKLKKFISKDKDAVIVFYGGEPLLEIDIIKKIIDNIQVPFRMQTNGKLLKNLGTKYLNKIKKILISIDGCKEVTDHNKGKGTYDLVIENINHILKKGYKGEIIGRMTISQDYPEVYNEVINLIDAGFYSIHFQIDCGFFENDFDKEKFSNFVIKYNKSITNLIDFWIKEMKLGKVWRIYPFMGIVESLLNNENGDQKGDKKSLLRCGAGHSGYTITTDGKIIPCPIMNFMSDYVCGDLKSDPKELKKVLIKGDCLKCDYYNICGGRCLYWNITKLWPKEGNLLICKTIKHLIDGLEKKLPTIQRLIDEGLIKKKWFKYEKYFGPEIIP